MIRLLAPALALAAAACSPVATVRLSSPPAQPPASVVRVVVDAGPRVARQSAVDRACARYLAARRRVEDAGRFDDDASRLAAYGDEFCALSALSVRSAAEDASWVDRITSSLELLAR